MVLASFLGDFCDIICDNSIPLPPPWFLYPVVGCLDIWDFEISSDLAMTSVTALYVFRIDFKYFPSINLNWKVFG